MRFMWVVLVLFAILKAAPSASAGSPDENGKTTYKPAEHAIKVTGGVRQTVTAVHPGHSPVEEEKSEAWWMTLSGLVLLLISIGAFFIPKAFMKGRRSWIWRDLIGEGATATMIRIISFILGVVGALIMLSGIITLVEGGN